jgi:hypothetical protein
MRDRALVLLKPSRLDVATGVGGDTAITVSSGCRLAFLSSVVHAHPRQGRREYLA